MKKLTSFIVLLLMLFVTTIARAEAPKLPELDIPVGEKNVGAAVSPMKKGQVAPFTGVLLSPMAVASMIAEMKMQEERTNLEVKRTTAELTATCDFEKNKLTIQAETDAKIAAAKLEASMKQVTMLEDTVSKSSDPFTMGAIGFGLGIAATVLIGYVSAQAAAR